MGFGYLFLGYLVAFLLQGVAGAAGVGALVLLLGYGMMWHGLQSLRRYCRGFSLAEWGIYPLLAVGIYRLAEDLTALFLWNAPFFANAKTVVDWIEFCLIMIFHAALLSAIREIGMQVELKKITVAAVRNMIIVLLYAVGYTVYWLPGLISDTVRGYLTLSITLLNLAWIFCNLWLLLTCTKDIVAEGQEDPEPKRYKWEFLNRMGDQFAENIKKATDSNREAMEEHLRKKQEKRLGKSKDSTADRTSGKHKKK